MSRASWVFLALCLLLFHGVGSQLSVGDSDAFLLDDLDTTTLDIPGVTPPNLPESEAVTEPPLEETTLPDFDDEVTPDEAATTQSNTDTSLHTEDELSKRTGPADYEYASDFGLRAEDERTTLSDPSAAALPLGITTSPSGVSARPSTAIRGLIDPSPDWIPNWPTEILQNGGTPTSRKPTIRFPTEPPSTVDVRTPVPSSVMMTIPTSVPSTVPSIASFTISKVPVTQYAFDLSSAALSPVPGPLFDPEDLNTRREDSPVSEVDLSRSVIDLASSIPELQSSVVMEASKLVSVTPTLSNLPTSALTEELESIATTVTTNTLTSVEVPLPSTTLQSTSIQPSVETEVVNNNLDDEAFPDDRTLASEGTEDNSPHDTTGPQPPLENTGFSNEGNDNFFKYTTADDVVLNASSPPSATENTTVPTDHPATGESQLGVSASSSVLAQPASHTSELAHALTPATLTSVRPTRTSQQPAASSRIPLWMLLSQSSPSQTVNTQLPSLTTNVSVTDTVTAIISTSVSTILDENVTRPVDLDASSLASSIAPAIHSSQVLSDAPVHTATAFIDEPDTTRKDEGNMPNVSSDSTPQQTDNDLGPKTPETANDPINRPLDLPALNSTDDTLNSTVPSSTLLPISNISTSSESTTTSLPTNESTFNPEVSPSYNGSAEAVNLPVNSVTPQNTDVDKPFNEESSDSTVNQSSVLTTTVRNALSNVTAEEQGVGEESVTVTSSSESIPQTPATTLNQEESISIIDPSKVISSPTDEEETWTPVIEMSVSTTKSDKSTVSGATTSSSTVTKLIPELTGGFTPIISETSSVNIVPNTGLDSTMSSTSLHTIVNSNTLVNSTLAITAPVESLSTKPAQSPSLVDHSSTFVRETNSATEEIIPVDHFSHDDNLMSSMILKDEEMSSTQSLSVSTQPISKEMDTAGSFSPMSTESTSTVFLDNMTLPASPPILVLTESKPKETTTATEKLQSSPPVYVSEDFVHSSTASPILSSQLETVSTNRTTLMTSLATGLSSESQLSPESPQPSKSLTTPVLLTSSTAPTNAFIPLSTVSPDSPINTISVTSPSMPSNSTHLNATITTMESTSPATPTTTGDVNDTSLVVLPREPTHETEDVHEASEEDEGTTMEMAPPTVKPPSASPATPMTTVPTTSSTTTTTTSTTTTTTTTTTEKTTTVKTTKLTAPPSTITTPLPVTTPSEAPITIVYPTESLPSLTTSMVLPNGTVVERDLPYVRALVEYSMDEFCQHRHNFRAMLAQWISQHMQEEISVAPHEIEFFNMSECGTVKPITEDHINLLPEDHSNLELDTNEKPNHLPDDDTEVTNVSFYVTQSGKIDPYLTEQFPLFPTELEISEELMYLKAKVSQLELVRPEGSTNSEIMLEEEPIGTSVIIIIVIATVVGVTIILALIFFMVVRRRGATNNYYGRRCTPVSMDAYSMDSVSVYHSFRRKSKRRASGRSVKSYLNQAFDDPNGPSRPLNFAKLTHFISDIDGVHEEFATIPVNMPKYDELPSGVEDKNRYANVIPVPETRVLLKCFKESSNSDYINANYVRGARNESKYYIATQAPLDDTVADFWRMVWEQESRVVVMLTDFVEKGIDKCADYLPPSETLDCHRLYGDFQVTLKSRDMREKFVVSNVQLKNLENNLMREVAHMWFTGWPAAGVPNEEGAFISYILDVRRTRKRLRAKGPIVVHCSPGTGRSGTFLACDIVMKQFEDQRAVDVPRTVYSIRRDRAGAVQTKEQYAFIYRVINLYASKLTTGNLDSL